MPPKDAPEQDTDPKIEEPTKDSTLDESTEDSPKSEKTDVLLSPDTDYEKRFKGLQPKHQQLVEEHKGLKSTYAVEKQEWTEEKAKLGLQVDELELELKRLSEASDGLTKSNEELQKTVDSLETKAERTALIMSEFPDLAVLEAKGLIKENLEGDELTKALNEMRSLMTKQGEAAVQSLTAGATGSEDLSSGQRGQAQDLGDIKEQLMIAQRNRDFPEVERLSNLLVERANIEVFDGGKQVE